MVCMYCTVCIHSRDVNAIHGGKDMSPSFVQDYLIRNLSFSPIPAVSTLSVSFVTQPLLIPAAGHVLPQ